jgi:hypothetical protein
MAHTHDHHGSAYTLEQLCLIAIGGALGCGVIVLVATNSLNNLLVNLFQWMGVVGGGLLLAIVVIRAVTLWQGRSRAASACCDHDHDHEHTHDHEHSHDHDHEHHHHDHDHDHAHDHDHDHAHDHDHDHAHAHGDDHGHDHSWNPVRYVILLLPVLLMLWGMPSTEFNKQYAQAKIKEEAGKQQHQQPTENTLLNIKDKGGDLINLGFKELEEASYTEAMRDFYEGKRGLVKGQFAPSVDDKVFTLVRFKITCCAADAVPMKVVIVSPESWRQMETPIQPLQWVDVTGQIQFRPKQGRDRTEYIPVLQLSSINDAVPVDAPANPFIQ